MLSHTGGTAMLNEAEGEAPGIVPVAGRDPGRQAKERCGERRILLEDAGLVAPRSQANLSLFEDSEPNLSRGVAFLLYRLSPGWARTGNSYLQHHTFPVYRFTLPPRQES